MPDIDPAALSRSDPILPPSGTPTITTKSLATSAPAIQKPAKTINTAQRIDLEPLYTSLRAAIGEHWAGYKEAISLFVLGKAHRLSRGDFEVQGAANMSLHKSTSQAI